MRTRKALAVLMALMVMVPNTLFMQGCSDQESNPIMSENALDTLFIESEFPGIPPESYPDAPPIPPLDSALRVRIETALSVMGVSPATIINQTGQWLGVRYLLGGNSKNGIDCSHLVYQVYRGAGITSYPYMNTATMRTSSRFVCVNPVAGDIILFPTIGHCGIYAGNGWMIDANSYYNKVMYDYLGDSYWSKIPKTAIRFIG